MSELSFVPVANTDIEEVFRVIKQGTFQQIDTTFGWDEIFQRKRFKSSYQLSWFHWVYRGSTRIGLVCFKHVNRGFHLHYIVILPEYRQKGYGKVVMSLVHSMAVNSGCDNVTLSCFKRDDVAVYFYKQLAYKIIAEEEHFYRLAREIT